MSESDDWRSAENFSIRKNITNTSSKPNRKKSWFNTVLITVLIIISFIAGYLFGNRESNNTELNVILTKQVSSLTKERDDLNNQNETKASTIISLQNQLKKSGKRYTSKEINEIKKNAEIKIAKEICGYFKNDEIKDISECKPFN